LVGVFFPELYLCLADLCRDYSGKKVALLGCGSSAIQILPRLQSECSAVYNFVRGGTWISQPFGSTLTTETLAASDEPGNYTYTADELHRFSSDPDHYKAFRKSIERAINMDYPCLFPGSPEELAGTEAIRNNMKTKPAPRPGLYEALEPRFVPGCRRLTPGPGYLEALTQENVQFIKTPIAKVLKNVSLSYFKFEWFVSVLIPLQSIVTSDGREYPVDAIACATGFDASFTPRFSVVGRDGVRLSDRWTSTTPASAYLSHSIPQFPNYFVVGGPNSATGGGSLLIIFESIIGYVVQAVAKIAREQIRSMEVKETALRSWRAYLDAYFPRTVHVDDCTSWYKDARNKKVTGLWPGSSLHARATLEHPRWEDYEYRTRADPLEWLGNGWTVADQQRGDLSHYLDHVDHPPIPSDEVLARQP
jgi:cation diffusion facilitator CzcD-associated flavoprotein CzcO